MVSLNGVSAVIHVDGQALQEFQTEIQDVEKTVSCWIPSRVGKEFTIRIRNTTPSDLISFDVNMDGIRTNSRSLSSGRVTTVDKCKPSPTTYQYFTFSQGQLVGDDELPTQSSNVAGLGTITINAFYAKQVKSKSKASSSDHRKIDIPDQRPIPEREKKGIQECIGLGRIEPRVPDVRPSSYSTKRLGPVAKIVFRYRPLAYLEAQGIAPSAPPLQQDVTPNPSKRKRTHDVEPNPNPSKVSKTSPKRGKVRQVVEISDEEDVEKLTALRARIDRALEKKGVPTTQVKKEVKAEPRRVILGTGIIDLT